MISKKHFKITKLLLLVICTILFACKQEKASDTSNVEVKTENELLYPRGSKITNNNFIGNAYLTGLVRADSINTTAIGSVYFEPGARSNWHLHPAGQIIMVTSGVGYYQEEGSAKRILKRGDVVKCPPNIPHWHGASKDREFVQVAITGRQLGPTEWLRPVTEEEYLTE